MTMKIGIIGAGQIGGTLTRRLTALGHEVFVANSRGPRTLSALADETGATAVSVADAARRGELVVVTIPEAKVRDLPKDLFGRTAGDVIVVDTGNYYPRQRDGRIDDRRFEEAVDWRDRTIVLRSLRRDDRPHHQVFLAQVNPQDMYLRFFGGVRELPPEALDRLLQPDPERELALAVVGEDANRVPEILAVGRACAEPDGVNAEIALLVRSDLKGFGLGPLLLERVIAWCSRRVTRRLIADVLVENTRMLRLARRHGFRVESVQDGVVRAMLELRGHPWRR